MKMPELVTVSKQSFLEKVFGVSEEALREKFGDGPELEEARKLLPTEDEIKFREIYTSSIPQLARLQRKMSVCLDVEVIGMSESFVEFEYGEKIYRLNSPTNAFKICMALEKNTLSGFAEMIEQKCIMVDGAPAELNKLEVDEIRLLSQVADKFFFQTFMA